MTLFNRSRDLAGAGYCAAFLLSGDEARGHADLGREVGRRLDRVLDTAEGKPLLDAARLAQLQACELMLSCLETLGPALGVADAGLRDAAIRHLAEACREERGALDGNGANGRAHDLAGRLAWDTGEAAEDGVFASAETLRRHVNGLALAGLKAHLSGATLPATLSALHADLDGEGTGFFEAYLLYLAWQIKTEKAIAQALSVQLEPLLRKAGSSTDSRLTRLYEFCGALSARFDAMLQGPDGAASIFTALSSRFAPLWWQRPRAALCRDYAEALARAGTAPLAAFTAAIETAQKRSVQPLEIHARFCEAAGLHRAAAASLNALGESVHMPQAARAELEANLAAGRFLEAAAALERRGEAAARSGDRAAGETLFALSGYAFELAGRAARALACHVRALELSRMQQPAPAGEGGYSVAVARIVRAFIRAEPNLGSDALKHAQSVVAMLLPRYDKARDPVAWARIKRLQADISAANGAALKAPGAYEAAVNQYEAALTVDAAFASGERDELRLNRLLAVAARAQLAPCEAKTVETALQALDELSDTRDEALGGLSARLDMARAGLKASVAAMRNDMALLDEADAALTSLAGACAASGEPFLALAAFMRRAGALEQFAGQTKSASLYLRAITAHEDVLQRCASEDSAAVLARMGEIYQGWAGVDDSGLGDALLGRALECLRLAGDLTAQDKSSPEALAIRKAEAAVLLKLARSRRDESLFRTACETLRDALASCSEAADTSLREGLALDLALDLALALLSAGETLGDAALVSEAERGFEAALAEKGARSRPAFTIRCLLGLGNARRRLATLRMSVAIMRRALEAHDEALKLAGTVPQTDLLARARERRDETAAALARLKAGETTQPIK